jgi:hypothetical protein
MKRLFHWKSGLALAFAAAALAGVGAALHLGAAEYVSGKVWPEPKIIDPGDAAHAPSDAIVLFDGKSLAAWDGGQDWIIRDGIAIPNKAGINTKQKFGNCQLHVEFATPEKVEGSGQGRGNSGVYMMNQYEIQILDSYDNKTYFDGQCGSIYKQFPPLVNCCRKPGQWQSYDILFEAPKFDAAGKLLKPAYVTVLQNGVVVQNHTALEGATFWERPPKYSSHPSKMPIHLQYHGNPVRFRNIWIRELP